MPTFAALRDAILSHLDTHLAGLDTPERVEALASYCQGLALDQGRKTFMGLANAMAPNNVEGCRQRMHRAIHRGRFSKGDVFGRLQQTVWEQTDMTAFCVDDTGFAKKGELSVGVQRQYSGTLGKIGNCQVAVSLHAASAHQSVCIDAQLYLPESWSADAQKRQLAGIPDDIQFQTKPEVALAMLRDALERGAPGLPVLADAGYGDSRDFRDAVVAMGLHFAVGVSSNTTVWNSTGEPSLTRTIARGRVKKPSKTQDMNAKPQLANIADLAMLAWQSGRFREIAWRRGSKSPKTGSFYALRVRSAEARMKGKPPSAPIWLVAERDETQKSRFKYYLSSLPANASLLRLVRLCKLRWRIERDYQDMKQEMGLAKYEGRTWGGFHRHFAMVALMHAFLALHREGFSPSEENPMDLAVLPSCSCNHPDSLDRPLPDMSQQL